MGTPLHHFPLVSCDSFQVNVMRGPLCGGLFFRGGCAVCSRRYLLIVLLEFKGVLVDLIDTR
jgi:hypothetical protein